MGGSRRITWLVFIVGVVAVVDVLGWVTWQVLRLEDEQARARAESARQEALGRALWRMDSIVLPLLAVESARPFYEYQAFYPANRPLGEMWETPREGDVAVPSPLLGEPGDFVLLHFERDAGGHLASPQAPAGGQRQAALSAGVPESLLASAEVRLYELERVRGGSLAAHRLSGANLDALSRDLVDETSDTDGSYVAAQNQSTSRTRLEPELDVPAPQHVAGETAPGDVVSNTLFVRPALPPPSAAPMPRALADDQAPASTRPDQGRQAQASESASREARGVRPASEPARSEPAESPADQRQDYAARQQVVENLQSYSDAGRANRTRGLEQRQAPPGTIASSEDSKPPAQSELNQDAGGGAGTGLGSDERRTNTPPTPGVPAGPPRRAVEASPSSVPPRAEGTVAEPDERAGLAAILETWTGRDAMESSGPTVGLIRPTTTTGAEFGSALNLSGEAPARLAEGSWAVRDAGPLTPLWLNADAGEPALVLVRQVQIASEVREQGVWLDWSALRRTLEASVSDLFPLAEVRPLTPASAGVGPGQAQRLATIPAVLIPGPLAASMLPITPGAWSPTRWTLLVGWIAVAIAVVAIGMVLRKAIELGERRGRFVSAVTHELRTPLTTFRLYSQMLAGGQVADEAKRQRYAQTLDRESQRLSAIVESVLEYARLGRRASGAALPRTALSALLERAMPALSGRAERAGMTLEAPASIPEVQVQADADKLERILLNLVDNACKYAGESPDKRIMLSCQARADGRERRAVLTVRDFGPGVPEAERARVFRAFHRAKHHDASASPGLGLGLAIARGLAREMKGDLRLRQDITPGAAFELELPVA